MLQNRIPNLQNTPIIKIVVIQVGGGNLTHLQLSVRNASWFTHHLIAVIQSRSILHIEM
jgi:hypothetical protein